MHSQRDRSIHRLYCDHDLYSDTNLEDLKEAALATNILTTECAPSGHKKLPAWLPLFRHRRLRFASKCRVHGNHFKLRLSAICTSVEAWPSQNCKQSQGTHTHWHCYRFCCPGQVLILLHLPVFIINTPTDPVYGRNTSRISEANKEGIANVNQTCITKSKSVLNVVYLYRNK